MKKAKYEGVYVKFQTCDSSGCQNITDLLCVCCDKWFCFRHVKTCVQCEQPVCSPCYRTEDLCCLVRPWGEKTDRLLKKIYQGKKFDPGSDLLTIIRGYVVRRVNETSPGRRDFVLRSMSESN